ncbi:hypothetical protein MRB53_034885 [Persea americana]|uniref:Uncharacterized protein n=1 Tax=Persea americana TaxID=3435 RepID=A0ACC2K3D5_PERAE|nr:hypothetical protein MRB53_034885 [Persea americana]
MGVQETVSLVVSSPTPVIPERIEEAPVPKESVTIPLVHTEAAGNQLPLESISQLEAKGDPSNTIASELPAVPEASTTMYETGAATDDLTRALAIEAQVTDFLEEQPEEVMDDSEEERQMDTSITPCTSANPIIIEGNVHDVDSLVVPQTANDASFKLVPSQALLKEQKDTLKIMLLEITQTLASGNLTQLTNC